LSSKPLCRGRISLAGLILLSTFASPAAADPRLLGTQTLAPGGEDDSIAATGETMLSSVRLCVAGSSLEIYDVAVYFAGGGAQEAHVRRTFQPGDCTTWIDLLGGLHRIVRVEFDHAATPAGGAPTVVTLWGR